MRRLLSAVLLSSVLALPTLAHADDAAIVEAQARFKEGLTLADKGKLDEARLKFLQAFAVVRAASVAYNLAITEEKTGHTIEAIGHYRTFLVSGVNDTRVTDAMRTKARASIAELSRKVGQIEVDVPADTKVTIDGVAVESLGEPVAVSEGRHTVEGTHAGRVKSTAVDAKIGEVTKASLTFAEEPATTTAMTTTTTEPPAEPPPQRTKLGWAVPIGLGVLGVAGLGLGIGMSSSSQSSKDESERIRRESPGLCGPGGNTARCAEYDDARDSAESRATAGIIGYVAGGAFLAGAVASWVFWPKSHSAPRQGGLTVVPLFGPGGGGGNLTYTF